MYDLKAAVLDALLLFFILFGHKYVTNIRIVLTSNILKETTMLLYWKRRARYKLSCCALGQNVPNLFRIDFLNPPNPRRKTRDGRFLGRSSSAN